jgi:hypothetical protein
MRQSLNRTWPSAILLVVLLGAPLAAGAASLKVSPARFMVSDVEPGRTYDIYKETGLRLTIFNDDDVERTWVLSTHRPSERGRWETGYGEIPDAAWCWFSDNEITVAPNSAGYGHLFLRVPDEEQYYNQHWIVTLNVAGRTGGLSVSLAVDIRVQIETKSKTGLENAPHGLLGMEPSAVRFEDTVPGIPQQASVLLYNNDDREHTYTIGSLFLEKKHEPKTYLKQSHQLLPERTWIETTPTIKIKPGGTGRLALVLNVPDKSDHFEKKWEDCILVKPDIGRAEFVRVQVETRLRTAEPATGGLVP